METNADRYWGEVSDEIPSSNDANFEELFKPKPAECGEVKLYQISCKETALKECSNQALPSIQPPLDSHGQNLLLHAIELKHHIRKMLLMKMAAQHQQAGGNKNDNLPQLPAAPLPPKKYCWKNGIYTRPHFPGIVPNPVEFEIKSQFTTGHGVSPVQLDNDSLRCLTYKAIAAICCHCGYESAHDLTLDVLSDVLADFLKRFTKLLRIALDAEASQRETRFPNVLEYVLQETGIGGLNALRQYWCTNIREYALTLEQEDERLMSQYYKLTHPECKLVVANLWYVSETSGTHHGLL
ncbi:STAGA complex 65 subunit gamma-like [Dendronephthya gigantea]|uniref:STAGA complex 65 subunit gamma-like n=1 Tax=Dendronephthya gigantea TaxID=151771 RepID=UPI00106B846A|nr:STAGA complex 65 subunit gamma-like [Dendronephthya gigantea]